jgi:hypothetical protein
MLWGRLQQDNRIISLAARGWSARLFVAAVTTTKARAGFAVRAQASFTVFTLITVQGFAQLSQGIEQGEQSPSALREDVLDVRGAAAVIAALDERVVFHVAQAPDQRAAADRVERRQEFRRPFRPVKEVAHDEHRPFVANHL